MRLGLQRTLEELLDTHVVADAFEDTARQRLVRMWHRLPAWPDVEHRKRGCGRLQGGMRTHRQQQRKAVDVDFEINLVDGAEAERGLKSTASLASTPTSPNP